MLDEDETLEYEEEQLKRAREREIAKQRMLLFRVLHERLKLPGADVIGLLFVTGWGKYRGHIHSDEPTPPPEVTGACCSEADTQPASLEQLSAMGRTHEAAPSKPLPSATPSPTIDALFRLMFDEDSENEEPQPKRARTQHSPVM